MIAEPKQKKPIPFSFTNHFRTGCRYDSEGNREKAEEFYQKAADECPELWLGVACEAMKEKRVDEAIERLIQVYRSPRSRPMLRSIAMNNIGTILCDKGHSSEAEKYFLKSLDEWKNPDAMANLSLVCKYSGRIEEAHRWIDKSIRMKPTSGQHWFTKSLLMLLTGDYIGGFREYESRWRNEKSDLKKLEVMRPEWSGEPLDGKTILLYAEQGAGDTLQMLRYGPMLKAMGARVLIAPQRGLAPICEAMGCFDAVHEDILDRIAKGNVPAYDVQCPTMSLPRLFRTTLETIPPAPYAPWSGRMAMPPVGQLKVGIAWAGSLQHAHDKWRSTSLESWAPLWSLPAKFYSLQVGPRSVDIVLNDAPIEDLSPKLKTFGDTADAINSMDLVIAVDTSVVHLAGAMGKPVWLVNGFSPDWRWLLNRTDSPWYPSVRQFRQPAVGDWAPVFSEIRKELSALC